MSFPINDIDDASLAPMFARYADERILDGVSALSGRLTLQRLLIDHSADRIAASAFAPDEIAAKVAFAILADAAVTRAQLRLRAAASARVRARQALRHAVTRLACAREAVIRILALNRTSPKGVASIAIGNDSLAQKHAAEQFALAIREHERTLGGPEKAALWLAVADAVLAAFHGVRNAEGALREQRSAVRVAHAALQGVVSEINEMLRVIYWDEPAAVARLKRRGRTRAAAVAEDDGEDGACCLAVAAEACEAHGRSTSSSPTARRRDEGDESGPLPGQDLAPSENRRPPSSAPLPPSFTSVAPDSAAARPAERTGGDDGRRAARSAPAACVMAPETPAP